MKKFKHTWPFWLLMFTVPIVLIVVSGCTKNDLQFQISNGAMIFHLNSEFLRSTIISICTSLIASGIVYIFIDKKLKELLQTEDEITVVLKSDNGDEVKCPPMSRKDFNRAEVLGYLGMLGGPERYEIKSLKTKNFGENIRKIQKSKDNQNFIVKCTDEEIKQFMPDYKKDNDDITIILKSENNMQKECPPISRCDFNRAEVLGCIGMLSLPERFSISSIKSPEFVKNMHQIKRDKKAKEFVVKCTDEEMKQFIAED